MAQLVVDSQREQAQCAMKFRRRTLIAHGIALLSLLAFWAAWICVRAKPATPVAYMLSAAWLLAMWQVAGIVVPNAGRCPACSYELGFGRVRDGFSRFHVRVRRGTPFLVPRRCPECDAISTRRGRRAGGAGADVTPLARAQRPMFLKLDKPLVNWSFPHRRGAAAAPGPAASRLAGRRSIPHRRRVAHDGRCPAHVTIRACRDLPSLRRGDVFSAMSTALARASRQGFRLLQFSIQVDHMHLLVEGDDAAAFRRGIQGSRSVSRRR